MSLHHKFISEGFKNSKQTETKLISICFSPQWRWKMLPSCWSLPPCTMQSSWNCPASSSLCSTRPPCWSQSENCRVHFLYPQQQKLSRRQFCYSALTVMIRIQWLKVFSLYEILSDSHPIDELYSSMGYREVSVCFFISLCCPQSSGYS